MKTVENSILELRVISRLSTSRKVKLDTSGFIAGCSFLKTTLRTSFLVRNAPLHNKFYSFSTGNNKKHHLHFFSVLKLNVNADLQRHKRRKFHLALNSCIFFWYCGNVAQKWPNQQDTPTYMAELYGRVDAQSLFGQSNQIFSVSSWFLIVLQLILKKRLLSNHRISQPELIHFVLTGI